MLRRLLDGTLYPHGLKVRHHTGFPSNVEGCVLCIPARYWSDHYDTINEALSSYRWVLGMRTSDEEDTFDVSRVRHDRIKWWIQTPRTDQDYGDARLFGVGFTPHFNSLPTEPPDKTISVYLSGQNTHGRRKECFDALENWHGVKLVRPTEGFTEGFEPREYVAGVVNAKVCPAPSGAVSVDTFRFFEALEAHCVPLADDVSPVDGPTGYWHRLFGGDVPFPILTHYSDLPGWIDDILAAWPAKANRVAAWWMRQRREYTLWLKEDLKALGAL